jgi:ABC-type transport system involved in cytochrome c biogenesis permease subunit
MLQAAVITYWFAMGLYLGATVLYVYFFLSKRRDISWYATFLTGAGFLMQTVSIAARWYATGAFPIEGAFNSLDLTAWVLVLVYFVMEHLIKIKTFGALLVPAAFGMMAIGIVLGPSATQLPPEQRALVENWRIWFHVILILLANAGFAVAAAAGAIYLVQERQIRAHNTSVLFKRLPSLAQADRLNKRAVEWAYPAFVVGVILGTLRAIEVHVPAWYFDPRVMISGLVLVVYGVYLVLRFRDAITGRQAAYYSLFAFLLIVVNAVLARVVSSGFHVFGVRV